MLTYVQGEYHLIVDHVTYRVTRKTMALSSHRMAKEVLDINGVTLLHLRDVQDTFPHLYNIVRYGVPFQEQLMLDMKPLLWWSRFLLRHAPLVSGKKNKKLDLTCNVIEMGHATHEWHCRHGYTIRSNKNYPYFQCKIYHNIPFLPHEINAFYEVFLFEKTLWALLYEHGASFDSDCACLLLSDYLSGVVSLDEFDEFRCYLLVGNMPCSMEQYERWKDKKIHEEEIHIYV